MRRVLMATLVVLFVAPTVRSGFTQIAYLITEIHPETWECTYTVSNMALAVPIKEFTIYFDYGLYDDLALVVPSPTGWDAAVWQPELGLGSGAYDAMTIGTGIGSGESVSGFSVRFDWLGAGNPATQYYEIVNPVDFTVIDSGYTMPEPSTCLFILSGLIWLKPRWKSHKITVQPVA